MSEHNLKLQLNDVLQKIEDSPEDRHKYQPRLHEILTRMRREGVKVPARIRQLDATLVDEAAEERFDNFPV